MEKIQAKDLTPEYVIEKLKDTHPLFKDGFFVLQVDSSYDAFDEFVPNHGQYANGDGRHKDLTLNYLRHSSRNELFDVLLENSKVSYHDYTGHFLDQLRDLWIKYHYRDDVIHAKIDQIQKLVESKELSCVLNNYKFSNRITYSFTDSPVKNCMRLQAVISMPYLADDGDFIINKYFPNLDLAAELLQELSIDTTDEKIKQASNYINDNKQEFYDKVLAFFKEIDYRSLDGTRINICDVEIDPNVVNLDVSVSKNNNLTYDEYEDPIMSKYVLIRLMQVQRSLEKLLEYDFVSSYYKHRDRADKVITPDTMFTEHSFRYFAQVSNSKHDYTTQKLLTHLNARLKNSKAKTREREILKTFKSQTAPIIAVIKEIYADIRPYVQPRSQFCVSEELERKLKKDVNTGAHVHTQEVIDKITSAIIETKALCDGYNEEYRRMLDVIAEDL
jgi:hypothetical protein